MKAFILTKKNQPSYSHERYVVLAKDKKELREILIKEALVINEFDIEKKSSTGLIYSDLY